MKRCNSFQKSEVIVQYKGRPLHLFCSVGSTFCSYFSVWGFILPILQRDIALVMLQVRDRAWFVRLYGEIIDRTGAQTVLYLTCTTITSVDLAHYGVSRVKDWVSGDCGTRRF